MNAEATTEADGGGPGCNRSAVEKWLGRSRGSLAARPTRSVRRSIAAGNRTAPTLLAQRRRRWDRSGRRARLVPDSPLFAEVAKLLRLQWLPEQIAGRRKRLEEGTEVSSRLRVSHEAIYAVPRGELRRELLACLRQGKPQHGRRSKDGGRRGRICD